MEDSGQNPAEIPGSGTVHNDLSVGDAVSSPIVQAGTILGGIHFHFPGDLSSRSHQPPPPASFDASTALLTGAQAEEAYDVARRLETTWDEGDGAAGRAGIEGLYRAAAEAGHADAMARVGLLAEGRLQATWAGQPPPEPSAAAVESAKGWYTRSAQRGSVFGALHLGRVHEEHHGKVTEALTWYKKAADGGSGVARARYEGLQKRLSLGLGALAGRRPFTREHSPSAAHQGITGGEQMAADGSYDSWIENEWGGSEAKAVAFCLGELSEACGGSHGEWGTLDENEQMVVLQHFSALHPTQVTLPAVAFEYQENLGDGNLRAFAEKLRARPGSVAPPSELAPVWLRKVRENKVSTEEFTYALELGIEDYDTLQWCIDSAVESMQSQRPRDDTDRENLFDLRMVARALTEGRNHAVPAAAGQNRWEVMILTTPELMALLKKLSRSYSRDDDGPEDFQAFWQRVDAALDSAPAQPFH